MIAHFDLVSIQELKSLTGLRRLLAELHSQTGIEWDAVASPLVGQGRAAEHYAFVYRTDRLQTLPGPQGFCEVNSTRFSRPPFFATFKAGAFDFTLLTVHVRFGTVADRNVEVEALAHVWACVQALDPDENDLILLGDFNRHRSTHRAFGPLRTLGLIWLIDGEGVFTTYSTLPHQVGANHYDNLWIDPEFTAQEFTGRSGVLAIHELFFRDAEHPHLEVRRHVSDHLPVWAEFSISGPDDD